jgi:hypothetical protein
MTLALGISSSIRARGSSGSKVMLPAGVIASVDHEDEKVYVNRTKDEVKNAPEFDKDRYRDDAYRGELGSYYGPGGAGWRDYGP